MQEKTVMAGIFKARCLALLDQVGIDRVPLVITKRGRPIARVVPMDDLPASRGTMGSVHLVAEALPCPWRWRNGVRQRGDSPVP